MKYLLTFLMLTVLAAPAAAQGELNLPDRPLSQTELLQEPMPGTDVRWFIWGVPPDDVLKYERVVLFGEAEGALHFLDDINDIKTLISYEFDQGRLWRVTYDMQKKDYPNPQNIINDYVLFEIMMNKRYGEPVTKQTFWKNDYYKDKHNRWGLAVYNGELELGMLWQTERTEAVMTLKAVDYEYQFRIVHTSRAIQEEREQAEQLRVIQPPPSAAQQSPSLRP